MRVLAVDYGLKRVGLASGNSEARIAFPKDVILRKSDDQVVDELLRICREEGYDIVVFGMPYNMDGSKSSQHEITQKFIEKFKRTLESSELRSVLKIEMVDERLSSFEADEYIEDLADSKRKIGERDMLAAKVILDRYFG